MSNAFAQLTTAVTRGKEASDTLYASATTRVFRADGASAADRVICKEYLGIHALQRLRNEQDLLARLAHVEGVIRVVPGAYPQNVLALGRDHGEGEGGGISLAQVLLAGKSSVATILQLAEQLTRTLAEIHRAGVIHRDVNPANILVCAEQRTVLIDFDLAVPGEQHLPSSQEARIVGTLGYMAPEQTGRTGWTVDQRADLYGLGATLYEMATGKLPFEAQDALQLVRDHLLREPVAPYQVDPQVPAGLSAIILRLLAKAPEQRYQSAEGLLHDLQRLRGELTQGHSGVFELGERDFAQRVAAPARLVGREAELQTLRSALANAIGSASQTVLIDGPAGVGKSALIHELRPAVAAAGGWFVHGKFDQYQKDRATVGALMQALHGLGRLLLAQDRQTSATMRQRILDSLGRNAGLATKLLPEFELLLGVQPDVPEVDPRQAELQLQQATVDLLGAIASPERPLVIVLDDLQWADAQSLSAFEQLMGQAQLRGLLLAGAWRTGEMDELSPMLARWRQGPRPPTQVSLLNLDTGGVTELVAQMLRLAPEPAAGLARAVGALTGGNPFDTVELINELRQGGVLSLGESGWQWDETQVRRFAGKGNVVDLLAARITRLPQPSRKLLELISCLGTTVKCTLLCVAADLKDAQLREQLRDCLADGLLVTDLNGGLDSVSFRHDRMQQAVLATMDDAQRTDQQLAMARRLARAPAFEAYAAPQYFACAAMLTEPAEQRLAARLFHGLAQKLAGTASFDLAERYLAAAATLLQRAATMLDTPPTQAKTAAEAAEAAETALRNAIDTARHAALYSLGRLGESDPLYAAMQKRAADPLELVEPTCLQMRSLDTRGSSGDALALGVHLLTQLGLQVPSDATTGQTEKRLDALAAWISEDSQLDHSKRAEIRDVRLLATAKLLGRTVRSAFACFDLKAAVWLLLESQRLWAEHGPCPELVANLGRVSVMLVRLRQDYRTAYEVARHVLSVGEALGYEPQASEARFVFVTYACHWFEPLENEYHHTTRAFDGIKAGGDVSYACYAHMNLISGSFEIAPNIDISAARVDSGMELCQRAGNLHATVQHLCERQLLRALRGQTVAEGSFDDAQFSEREFLERIDRFPYLGYSYSQCRTLYALLMGDIDMLVPNAVHGIELVANVAGFYISAYAHFSSAMARAWQLQQALAGPANADASSLMAELETSRNWLASRAVDQPYNFLHLLRLVEAEQAWALGHRWEAARYFNLALMEAQSRQRPWHRALITERAGLFQLTQGLAHTGGKLLEDALDQYKAWGAQAKVQRMLREHEFLRPQLPQWGAAGVEAPHGLSPGSTSNFSADALDLIGVLRASQALSSETSLERITARVTDVVASLSGATKVLVLWANGDQWQMLASLPGEPSLAVALAAEQGLLPLSAFAYAQRTGQALVVDDAVSDDRFAGDPYFADARLCSLLLAPISNQGTTRAMLYLENRQGRAAFNAQRLDAVMLIAGQLAVSLANAQLYENLEQRVQVRTHELELTQAQLITTARRAGMAEIANNVLHNVGNVLNSVNVSANVVRNTIVNSRISGLTRAVALMNEQGDALAAFIGQDPRGKTLLPYLNQLVETLEAERQNALGDLDRLARSIEHITYVVATQQSHAGPSSVLEMARPQELLEEALHMSADAIMEHQVAVVRRPDNTPALELDRPRMLQILVNLITNAAQAMESMPGDARCLTVGTGLVRDVDGERLQISVQDAGEGITAESLKHIFAHGFTTRRKGHGFGLHSSALAALEMGGRITAHSDGPGHGAVFTLEVPVRKQKRNPPAA